MPQVNVFKCPSCGASISASGEEAQTTCQFCGNTVMVPEAMRVKRPEPPPRQIPYQPQIVVSTVTTGGSARRGGGLAMTLIILAVVACVTIGIIASVVASVGTAAFGLAPAVTAIGAIPTVGPVVTNTFAPTATPSYAGLALTFGGEGTGAGKFNDPRAIGVDGQGNVFVGEYTIARVQKFDSAGQYLSGWTTTSRVESAPLRNLAADRAGNVYVVRAGQILKYDGATGELLATFEDERGYDDVIVLPDGRLLGCACFGADDLVFLDADGQQLSRVPAAITSLTGDAVSNLKLAVDGLGTIFVLSTKHNTVFKFSADGVYADRFGARGDEPGQFVGPSAIAVDSRSRVYVSDFKGIQVFTADGQYLDVFDGPGGALLGLAFSAQDELYAASNSNEVYKFVLTEP